jgi:ABC-type multidrug transport system ATPase subunit
MVTLCVVRRERRQRNGGYMEVTDSPLLTIDRIFKESGTRTLFDNVSLEVRSREVVGVSGPRGTGKRNLIDLIVGNDQVESGRIIFNGQDITALRTLARKRLGILSPLQQPPLLARVREAVRPRNLEERLAAALVGFKRPNRRRREELIEEMLVLSSLLDCRKRRLNELSAGQRQQFLIVEMLICSPTLIVLDEPFKYFDAITLLRFEDFLESVRERTAILLTDRSGDSSLVCDRVYLLENGKIGPVQQSLKIFINYRREDDPGFAQALFQRLESAFDSRQLFMDVEGQLKPGDNYGIVLRNKVASCDVLLAVIGPRWLAASDENGRRRLGNPDDWVRTEIASALEAGKTVIPVLVGGAAPPRENDLPEPLKPLSQRQAVRINAESFKSDSQRLVRHLQSESKLPSWSAHG